jgi:hypothetical protein
MRVLFINNDGGGYADYVETEDGATVEKFFAEHLSGRKSEDYLIRVNRQPVPCDYVLQEGDRVSMTPTKIEGATSPYRCRRHWPASGFAACSDGNYLAATGGF